MSKNKELYTTGYADLIDTVRANIDARVAAAATREFGKLKGDPKREAEGERDLAVAKYMSETLHRLRTTEKAVADPAAAHCNPTLLAGDFTPKITLTRDTKKFRLDKNERKIDENKGWRKI